MPLSSFQPDKYSALLQEKKERLESLLKPFDGPALTVFESPVSGFRMRAEFRFWHDEEGGNYAMFPKGCRDTPVAINELPIAHPRINALMQALRNEIRRSPTLKTKLYQVEFIATLSGDSLVTMIYHQRLGDEWREAALAVQDALSTSIIGRSRNQKIVLGKDHVDELLHVGGDAYHQKQPEGSFTQPNACINQCMLSWAQQVTADATGDLLELYCGNGNFTVALAKQFGRILATEISKISVHAALHNFASNHIANVQVCRMSGEEITAALNGSRKFRRLEENRIDLDGYNFSTVLVDPPRSGLDDATLQLVGHFERILYISCNPATLVNNLATLCKTHSIRKAALFDQFPYTEHVETGLLLVRKNG